LTPFLSRDFISVRSTGFNFIAVIHFTGAIWVGLGLALLICLIPAYYFGDGGEGVFASVGLAVLALGGASRAIARHQPDIRAREALFSVVLAWLTVSFIGALPFYFTGCLNLTDAMFESVSGFTTTGASVIPDVEIVAHSLIFWRSFTHFLGGMGIVVMSLALLPLLGYGGVELFQTEAVGPVKDKLTPRVRETARALWVIYISLIAMEAVLLRIGGMPWFDSLCHSFGTVATGGFSTKNASIGFYESNYISWVVIIFMLLGGVNFALHFRVLRKGLMVYLRDIEFRFWILTVIAAVIFIYILGSLQPASDAEYDLTGVAFSVVSMVSTTGFFTVDFDLWQPAGKFILLLFLFSGSCAGSTCGSIKMFRWVVAYQAIRLQMRRNLHPQAVIPLRVGNKIVSDEVIKSILIFIIAYIVMVMTGALVIMATGVDMISAFSGTSACAAGCGPGLNELGATETYAGLPALAKYVLIVEMLFGRLEIFSFLVLFTRGYWRP
jgi:trk system potassium uptake protein TrkH